MAAITSYAPKGLIFLLILLRTDSCNETRRTGCYYTECSHSTLLLYKERGNELYKELQRIITNTYTAIVLFAITAAVRLFLNSVNRVNGKITNSQMSTKATPESPSGTKYGWRCRKHLSCRTSLDNQSISNDFSAHFPPMLFSASY